MKFKGYYGKQFYSTASTYQLYKNLAIYISVLVSITEFDPINQIVIRVDICNRILCNYNLDVVD